MKNENCAYCMKDDNPSMYEKFGYRAFDMKTSTVFVFKEQTKYLFPTLCHTIIMC